MQLVANYNNDTRWRHRVAKMTQSPASETGVGTITHEEVNFLGRRYVTIARVTVFEPDKRLAWASIETTTPISGLARFFLDLLDQRGDHSTGICRLELPHG
jgi:hypothetical protein